MIGGLTRPQKRRARLLSTTLRGFDDGKNIVDDPMNLKHSFAVKAENIYSDDDGSMRVRGGTVLFKDAASNFTAAVGGIIGMKYFNASIISVGGNGQVLRTQANGTTTRIWDTAIAALLPGAPAAWTSGITFVSFAEFNGELVLCNGVDKPILISAAFTVTYLQDLATLTNVNTPICRYVVSCQRFLVMAGDPVNPSRVHISCRDAGGTWYNDPAPNDATRIDVGSIVDGGREITGLLTFREKLLTFFQQGTVVGTLGIYDATGNHTPDFNDGINDYGCCAHNTAIAAGDDGLMLHSTGVLSLRRTVLNQQFKPDSASDFIDSDIATAISGMSTTYLSDRMFAVYLHDKHQYILVVPRTGGGLPSDTCTVFVYNYRASTRKAAWSLWTGWRFKCACVSADGTLFFADLNSKIWRYSATAMTDDGVGIDFDWTTPWIYFGDRDAWKNSKYISFDTRGAGVFTAEMYTDNNDPPAGGNVALSATFDLGTASIATTGRKTTNKKLFAWPCKFQMAAFRFSGTTTTGPITRFVAFTLKYLRGSIRG